MKPTIGCPCRVFRKLHVQTTASCAPSRKPTVRRRPRPGRSRARQELAACDRSSRSGRTEQTIFLAPISATAVVDRRSQNRLFVHMPLLAQTYDRYGTKRSGCFWRRSQIEQTSRYLINMYLPEPSVSASRCRAGEAATCRQRHRSADSAHNLVCVPSAWAAYCRIDPEPAASRPLGACSARSTTTSVVNRRSASLQLGRSKVVRRARPSFVPVAALRVEPNWRVRSGGGLRPSASG
jgi:hypothetical protein